MPEAAAPQSVVTPEQHAVAATSLAPAKVTPGSKAWAEMTAEQRHAALRGPEKRIHGIRTGFWRGIGLLN
jgi:hypothetical protein